MNIIVKLTRSENLDYYKKDTVEIDIEEYLRGVVPSEIGSAALSAGKAQAIAARTFALNKFQKQGYITDKSEIDQAFRTSRFSLAYSKAHQAVEETAGEVLFYNNKLITNAHYCASNGGRTYSSEEKWGGKRAYLIAQDDPWDIAAGAINKNGHGVGLSQRGAKYAASIGIPYTKILSFYYPGTQIKKNYGGINNMAEVYSNLHFVEFLKKMVGQPYWYGTCVYKCTSSLLRDKTKQYPTHYTSGRMNKYNSHVSENKVAADCVGLGKGYLWTYGGKGVIESIGTSNTYDKKRGNRCPDRGANGMFSYAKSKGLKWGEISTIPEIPGLAVHKDGHVGYYIGNGLVVEAQGFDWGIVITKLNKRPWTHWYEFPGIVYSNVNESVPLPEVVIESIPTATVTTEVGRLNLRAAETKASDVLIRIPNGEKIPIYSRGDVWCKTSYGGKNGYVMSEFLTFSETPLVTPALKVYPNADLQKGSKGSEVEQLQMYLVQLGYDLGAFGPRLDGVDGSYGNATVNAVRAFQKAANLKVDGICNTNTWAAIMAEVQKQC